MKTKQHKIFWVSALVASILMYVVQYAVFNDYWGIINSFFGKIAFVPIQVFLITVVISGILSDMDKSARLEKLNILIGTFFSETGTKSLKYFSKIDPHIEEIGSKLKVTDSWSEEDFKNALNYAKNRDYILDASKEDILEIYEFLSKNKEFLMRLLENPNLMEHEHFTDLLRAVFHLLEELESRENLHESSKNDIMHLNGDMVRSYQLITIEWVNYMKYLKNNYPYLFSLAMRRNPFDKATKTSLK
ncbi:conserved hypothetical protein [Methanococcus maripaludis C5]|uniref:Uncharacterized protein n=1 Tax=Methanococcus maripaludis (strain C5 / ATCC BAA-1333) TaxID=402880 RepID=A4FZX5_METM5|nr:hypothetical protein [Methanococcus maripaludis]ABO35759.1 conserved hypothetical protein [Methanococcus maripaludis C5]